MPHPSPPRSPESLAAMQELFFGRFAEISQDIAQWLSELTREIEERDLNACLGAIVCVEARVDAMRNILVVAREHLGQ